MPNNNMTILNLAFLCLIALSPAVSATTGCYTTPGELVAQGTYQFQSNGYCQQICTRQNHTVYALHNGNECSCGDQLPPSSDKVADTECDSPCSGFPSETCGSTNTWTVITDSSNAKRDDDSSVIVTAPDTPDPMATYKVNPTMVETGIAIASTGEADSVPKTAIPSVILTAPSTTAPQHGSSATASSMVIAASSAAASSSGVASPSASAGAGAGVVAQSGSILGGMVVCVAVGMFY
ncbi:hypothetical protein BO70DRAFT_349169 [Aspergillus heteromorphus CBS 117.55]|uniref:WSC domain-containing protein n=1 Tax=Aspergillus heteromorphus CBS 117.55 TaxID=1448321 RepID=A0A317X2T7_9EURO|nr:uncharacterized protein BO70DRAFT_349169 [Aspergillus heteromorphus CBS 117.55]PWY92876.1 hypothetical protein BO70DRAFT_349169 [Aspergillus heteromorphus CBS 117.55]